MEGDIANTTSNIKDILALDRRQREYKGIGARFKVIDKVIFLKVMDF